MALPKILRYPNFRKLYFAGLASELGSFITETALMLTIYELSSQNKAFLGFARAAFLVFLTLGNIIGGVIGEKFNRRQVLLFTNYARIPIVLALFYFKDPYFLIAMDGLIALFTGIYNPTRQALVNDLVPQKDITKANGMFGSTMAILHILGPLLGATLYAQFKGINEVLAFDMLTYFLGIYLIGTIAYTPPSKNKKSQSIRFISETMEGVKYVLRKKDLFAVISNVISEGICIGFLFPLMLPFFTDVLQMGETSYGVAMAAFGLGGCIGGWLSHRLSQKYTNGKLIIWNFSIEPILMICWLNFVGFYQTCFIFLIWGIVVFVRMTSQLNYISDKVDTKYLTRVYSLLDLAFVVPNILAGIIVSMVGNYYGTLDILKIVSILFIFLVYPRLFFKDMKLLYNSNRDKVKRDESTQDLI